MTCLTFPFGEFSWQLGDAALADDAPPTAAAATAAAAATTSNAHVASLALVRIKIFPLRPLCQMSSQDLPTRYPVGGRVQTSPILGDRQHRTPAFTGSLRLRFGPVVAHADLDRERRIQRIGVAHLRPDELADRAE